MRRVIIPTVLLALSTLGACVSAGPRTSLNQDLLWPASAAGRIVAKDRVTALIRRGDALAAKRRWQAARWAYSDAAELQRAQGQLPSEPLRRLANSYYFERRHAQAARVLDRLAEQAAAYGDLPVQARSLADAAWLYAKAGRKALAKERLARLRLLMTSPYLPERVRDRMALRVGAS